MKCYYHTKKEGVATCQGCGKALCKECFDKTNNGLCENCESKEIQYQKDTLKGEVQKAQNDSISSLIIYSIIALIGGIVGLILLGGYGNGFLIFYLCAGIPFGWMTINKLPLGTWIFSGIMILIMLIIKLFFSAIIGCVWPILLIIAIYRVIKTSKIKKEINKD